MTDRDKKVIDAQDPLPESNWFWRRVYTFVLSLVSVAFIWFGLESLNAMKDPDAIYRITRYMIGVHVLLITYYMVAPSAEQIVKLIQAARLMRSGVPITRHAVVETPETRTEVSATANVAENPEETDTAPRSKT